MPSITKITSAIELDSEIEALKDNAATQRALDYYLKPAVSQPPVEKKVFVVGDDVSQEEALVTASDYLRCGISMMYGTAETHGGAHRDQFLAVAFIVESAKQLLDRALDMQKLPTQ
ncbi:hypothetical protein AQS70_01525 [Pseudomonas endophytica]|uniref:DUF3077 domain-containing protein n=1 Tax=Pseudomonas endophytica TaxID=1563157 RepID=A0A0Q0YXA1_9PSED|nr:hypothetical protein [Pseudomonas endophytica]KQB54161.1 hypothetical protein AQS70_01525 [Pseudomonas endophytica]